MRIALTVLTPQGARDVILTTDNGASTGQIAEALRATFTPKKKAQSRAPDKPAERLAPVTQLPVPALLASAAQQPQAPQTQPQQPQGPQGPQGPPAAQRNRKTLWIDGRPVPPETPATTALRDGAVVTIDPGMSSATVLAEPTGVAELRVIGGPGAGSVHRLAPGHTTIGSSPDCHVQLPMPGVPPLVGHLTIPLGQDDPVFEPAATAGPPGNDAKAARPILNGQPVEGTQPWPFGGVLRVGAAAVMLARPEQPDAYLSPVEAGGLAYHRPPRLRRPSGPVRIEVPIKPRRSSQTQMLLVGMTIPLILGGVMVYVTGQFIFALFILMSPAMMATQLIGNRKGGTSYRKKKREYRKKAASLPARLDAARVADEITRRDDNLDPTQILLTATGPRRRLWERRADDRDVLRLRVGLVDAPARIRLLLEGGEKDEQDKLPPVPTAFCVPVAIQLPQLGVIGLAGPIHASRALARSFVAQAAVLHSPSDLSVVVLTTEPAASQFWNWVRWLPHTAPRGNEECISLIGTDLNSSVQRVSELLEEVNERLAKLTDTYGSGFSDSGPGGRGAGAAPIASSELGPKILVILDGARQLRRIPGMPQLLAAARKTGIYSICIDETQRVLPEECAAVLTWDTPGQPSQNGGSAGGEWNMAASPRTAQVNPTTIRMRGSGLDQVPPVLGDQVTVAWASRVARALAPVRDVSKDDSAASIPDSARLLDLIHMPDPSADMVLAAWQRYGRSTRAPVGIDADGTHVIDISADGPHGLIAGTTGAGKSEFLQTLIASLAIMNRPDAMTFVLIDYKGGSAFKDCARLPHTVGMVTDLDGHLTVRALDSLGAELKRREELLLHAGAKDIDDYQDTLRIRPDLEPMPRLVLIIDEFAAMVATLPDFVTGLIDIARRGRSLGVHLILATQRPAGVVSADIRANTNLRIALRVTSKEESEDVIETGDAANIAKATPGRCYIRSGALSPLAVQSARVGGRRPGTGSAASAARIVHVPWPQLGLTLSAPPAKPGDDEIDLATDLSVLTEAIIEANAKAEFGEQRRPWLTPLPEIVTLDELPKVALSRTDIPPIPFGLTDLPMQQAREALTLDFADAGHTVVAGAAHTGRSALLRTLAGSVARNASPSDVHIYCIDCGTGALLPVAELEHCGAVAPRDQPDRIERLLDKLRAEVNRRQQLLAAQGFTGLLEQRAATTGTPLPWMLLLLDWWEGYVAAFEQYDFGRLVEDLLQLLREGSAVGLRAVVSTDRSALVGQTGAVFSRRLLLRLSNRDDATHADVNERTLPNHQPNGRVMFAGKPHPLEAQIALLDHDPAGLVQARALREIAAQAAERYEHPPAELRPLRVDALPTRITVSATWKLDEDFVPPSPLWALVGAGGDELGPVGLDVNADGPGLIVAGPPRSGRSTALMAMAKSLLRAQTPIMIITPRRSPLRSLDGAAGVVAVRGADFDVEEMRELLNPLERYVVLVDDAEILHDAPGSEVLDRIILTGRDTDHGLILAGATGDLGRAYTGFIASARKSRAGVLVTVESPDDGDLFGLKLPRNARRGALGRGLLVRPGFATQIQIPVDEDS